MHPVILAGSVGGNGELSSHCYLIDAWEEMGRKFRGPGDPNFGY